LIISLAAWAMAALASSAWRARKSASLSFGSGFMGSNRPLVDGVPELVPLLSL
jgi:hypothetical protein